MKTQERFKDSDVINIYNNITHLEASTNYTIIHFEDGSCTMLSYSLKRYEVRLQTSKLFARIHRHYLVNRSYIAAYYDTEVQLKSGLMLPISRRRQG
jgi:two-component system, LytTR family, response regulator